MEQPEVEKGCSGPEDGSLGRNRSFKSKQLVRSQAIRESTSPPRTISPYAKDKDRYIEIDNISASERDSDTSSHSDRCSVITNDRLYEGKQQPVEIQITPGAWDTEGESSQRLRTRRWLGHRHHSDSSQDLLSYNPRVACVCGACACPHCRGRRRKHACPTKQDSGIVCSDDCPDCSETDHAGPNGDEATKSGSFDADDQTYYCRCPERKEKPKSYSFNDFEDKPEPSLPELVHFIKETLNKNPRDRMTLLKIEKELYSLVNDSSRCIVRFPVMTSYGRMLVHRCAALFELGHHLDHANKNSVLVSKSGTCGGRVPCTSFRAWCTAVFPRSPPPARDTLAKSILKRDGGSSALPAAAAGRSKSLEQRERDYESARRRIFSADARDEAQWAWLAGAPVRLLAPDAPRNRLLKVQSLEGRGTTRGPVSKSHSFGGYTTDQPRVLSRQGDLASSSWRLSPSSSGYKTLSLRSTDSVTPSPTGGASPEPNIEGPTLVWAVTDMSAVPPGALVIHPQFQVDVNSEKRRGKLEKQHSFIDNECECQSSDDCRTKCCCDYRSGEDAQSQPQPPSVKNSPQKQKPASNPTSPNRNPPDNRPQPPAPEPEPPAPPPEPKKPEQKYEIINHPPPNEPVKQIFDQRFEPTNQRPYELASQRPVYDRFDFQTQNQRIVKEEIYPHYIPYPCRNDEIMSPHTMMNFAQPEMTEMSVMQAKVTPIPMPDPNMRPMSLSNVMYPAVPQQNSYQFINTACRIEQTLQPAQMYQPLVQQPEEQKQLTSAPHNDNTFRIDPSYPYSADLNAACGSCDPNTVPRGYNMPYGQVEVPPQMMQPYSIPNVLIQPPIQHYPYQEQMPLQWQNQVPAPGTPKLMLQELYPLVYPNLYQPYNILYPQVMPQQYPYVQPMYPIMDKQTDIHRSHPRPKRSPSRPVEDKDEITVKIQQIKEQMAQMNTRDKARTEWRRNSGGGLLGTCPLYSGRVVSPQGQQPAPAPERCRGGLSSQWAGSRAAGGARLGPAAQALVQSLRHTHAKHHYAVARPFEPRAERPELRPRRSERSERRSPRPCPVRQISPGTWCRRSPGPLPPAFNQPRRPHPDSRNGRR